MKKEKQNDLTEFVYQSPFDGFTVQLYIGPCRLFKKAQPAAARFGFRGKTGATIGADGFNGVLVWLRKWKGDSESFAALFHELTHASIRRFTTHGGKFDSEWAEESIAHSVDEFGKALLDMIYAWQAQVGEE